MRTLTPIVLALVSAALFVSANGTAQERPASASPSTARPLLELLREQAASAPIDLRVDPAVADRLVDVSLEGFEGEAALKRVLLASSVDFVMAWKGGRLQILAGDLRAAVDVPRGPAGAAVAGPEPRPSEIADGPVASSTGGDARALPPAPEAEAGATVSDAAKAGEGAVTGAQMLALLSASPPASPTPNSASVELPFTDATGQPVRVSRPAETPGVVQLPFTDENGQPMIQVAPVRKPGVIELPFPDEFGRPIRLASPPPSAIPRRSPPGDE